MKLLFNINQLNKKKSMELLPLECCTCGKTFYKTKHYIVSHILNPNSHVTGDNCSNKCSNQKRKSLIITKTCAKCGKPFNTKSGRDEKNFCSSFCSHSRTVSDVTKQKISNSMLKSDKFKLSSQNRKCKQIQHPIKNLTNNGKYKQDSYLITKKCPICKNDFKVIPYYFKRIYCSRTCYNADHKLEYRTKLKGGYRKGSGRGKSGWYKGYWCDSSWELAWVIYNLDNNILFKRNTQGFPYRYQNKECQYFPDFVQNDVYIEIKGYETEKNKQKYISFPHQLRILHKNEIKPFIEYVKQKYGNDFIELYDQNPHKQKKNKCLICGSPAKFIYCSRKCSGVAVSKKQKPHIPKPLNKCLSCGKDTKSKFCSLSCSATYINLHRTRKKRCTTDVTRTHNDLNENQVA